MSLNTFTTPTGIGQGNSILTQILITNRQIEQNTQGGIGGGGGFGEEGEASNLLAGLREGIESQFIDPLEKFLSTRGDKIVTLEGKINEVTTSSMAFWDAAESAILSGVSSTTEQNEKLAEQESKTKRVGKALVKGFLAPAKKFGKDLVNIGGAMISQQLITGPTQAFFQGFLGRFEIFGELAGAAGEILGQSFNPVVEDAIFNFTSWIKPMEGVATLMTPLVDGFSLLQTWFGVIGAGITDLINESIEPASKGVQTSEEEFDASLTKIQTDLDDWGVVTEQFWTDILAFFAGETTNFEAEVTGPDGSLPTFEKKGIASIDNFTTESNTALDLWGGTDGTGNTKFAAGLANFDTTVTNFDWNDLGGEIIKGIVGGIVASIVNLPDLFVGLVDAIWTGIVEGFQNLF